MKFKSFFNFTTQKLLVIEDYRVGGLSRFFQLLVILFIIYDLLTKQLYFKTEIPSGYTTVWAESDTGSVKGSRMVTNSSAAEG